MKKCLSLIVALLAVIAWRLAAQDQGNPPPLPYYLREDYSETGRPLPPGVPRTVDTNGEVIYIPHRFTTPAYRDEALKLVIQEANKVAKELNLSKDLPITETNLVEYHMSPFGFAYAHRMIGNVTTKSYMYGVAGGNKFNCIVDTHEQEKCWKYYDEGYVWPVSRIDTNTAYKLAEKWLSAVHMDVAGLNHDCHVKVTVDSVFAQAPPGKFIPTYFVSWEPHHSIGDVASVRLFAPTKTLLDLTVGDPKYILRKPIEFTNMAALFPGFALIQTNHSVPMVYMAAPRSTVKPVVMPNGEVRMMPNN